MSDHYTGPERRNGLSEDRARVLVESAVSEHDAELRTYLAGEFASLRTLIKSAFPRNEDGEPDLAGHRMAHESMKATATQWSKIKSDFISNVITTGWVAGVGILLYALWEYAKVELRK